MGGLVVRPRARILHGHDWVYGTEVLKTFGNPQDGDVVSIKDGRDRMLGSGVYNSKSQIVARRFSRRRQDLDAEFFTRRLQRAQEFRDSLGIDTMVRRVLWSESDGVPGVIVDRFRSVATLQTLTMAMDQRRGMIAAAVKEVLGVESVIERNDSSSRKAEGLEVRSGVLLGPELGAFEITVAGMKFHLDPIHGQKTGFYLDQTASYRQVAAWAKGKRVLDCFSNQGAFAIACAQEGAAEVTAVESGKENLPRIEANARLNAVSVKVIGGDVFEVLSSAARCQEEYDMIILDPPPFTRTRRGLPMHCAATGNSISRRRSCLPRRGFLRPSPAPTMSRPRSSVEALPRPSGTPAGLPGSSRPMDRARITLSSWAFPRANTSRASSTG